MIDHGLRSGSELLVVKLSSADFVFTPEKVLYNVCILTTCDCTLRGDLMTRVDG
jgi:hypothetical protein